MSVAHSGVSFNHSCLKVPVDPTSKRPSPTYERIFNCKLSDGSRSGKYRETSAVSSTNSSTVENYKSVESYLQFYETIPDYSELHHLSDEEFYSRLKSLKITQKRFCNGTSRDGLYEPGEDRPSSHSSLGGFRGKYKPEQVYGKSESAKKNDRASSGYSNSSSGQVAPPTSGYIKKMKNRWTMKKAKPPKINVISDSENISDLGVEDKSCRVDSAIGSWKKDGCTDDGWISDDGFCCRKSKSMPSSPGWKPKICRYTPVCDCCLDDHLHDGECRECPTHRHYEATGVKKRDSPKKQRFNTRPVPLLSRIPLFEKIMAEQEERRRVNHNRYSRELRALVQPFSFTKREEEEKQKMRMTCSNPELNASPKRNQTTFKAKPIPRNLFSNYAYERMREEDFYRALKKRIRAEEMLKSSSLPPSMAAREKFRSKSLDYLDKEGRNKLRVHKRACEVLRREIDFDEKNRSGKNQKRRGKPFWLSKASTDSSTEVSPYESVSEPERRHQKRPHSAISINRSNLASVLRMQTTRKRLEKEMADSLEESRLKQQAKFKERLIRMTPAWRALNYSTEEDLALRVAARREEERLKKKRYDKLMGSIYGRVHKMPPLFQRQSSSTKQTKRSREESEPSINDYKYKGSYHDQKTRKGERTDEPGEKFSVGGSPTRYRSRSRFSRVHNSSESSGSHEKSEGSKMDESDNETGSREDEIDGYGTQQGEELERTSDSAQKGDFLSSEAAD